jgi:Protein of unknown function (DUF998)
MQNLKAARSGILGVLLFVVTTIIGGILFPGYSHTAQFISESYAIGTAHGPMLRFLGFLPSGLCIAAFAYYAVKALPKSGLTRFGFAAIGIFYGLATVMVSIFPCDAGCDSGPVSPSVSQLIHNLSGFLTYMIVPLSLILLGITARRWPNGKTISTLGIVCGITAMLFVGILTANLHSGFVGLYQRIIEGSILFWVLACSLYLRRTA